MSADPEVLPSVFASRPLSRASARSVATPSTRANTAATSASRSSAALSGQPPLHPLVAHQRRHETQLARLEEQQQLRVLETTASDVYREAKHTEHAEAVKDRGRALREQHEQRRAEFEDSHQQLRAALSAYEAEQQRVRNDRALFAHHAKFAHLVGTADRIRNDRLSRVARRNYTKKLLEDAGQVTAAALIEDQARRGVLTPGASPVSGLVDHDNGVVAPGVAGNAHLNTSAIRERSVRRMLMHQHNLDASRLATYPTVGSQLLHSLESPMMAAGAARSQQPQQQRTALLDHPSRLAPRPTGGGQQQQQLRKGQPQRPCCEEDPQVERNNVPPPSQQQQQQVGPSRVSTAASLTHRSSSSLGRTRSSTAGSLHLAHTSESRAKASALPPLPNVESADDDDDDDEEATSVSNVAEVSASMSASRAGCVDDPFPEVAQHANRAKRSNATRRAESTAVTSTTFASPSKAKKPQAKGSIHAEKAARESKLFIRHVVEAARRSHRLYRESHPSPVKWPGQSTEGVFAAALRTVSANGRSSPDRDRGGISAQRSPSRFVENLPDGNEDGERPSDAPSSVQGDGFGERPQARGKGGDRGSPYRAPGTAGGRRRSMRVVDIEDSHGVGANDSAQERSPTSNRVVTRRLSQVHFAFSKLNKSRSQLQVAKGYAQSWLAEFREEQLERQRRFDERRAAAQVERKRIVAERDALPAQPTLEDYFPDGLPPRRPGDYTGESDIESDGFEVVSPTAHLRSSESDGNDGQQVLSEAAAVCLDDPFPPPPPGAQDADLLLGDSSTSESESSNDAPSPPSSAATSPAGSRSASPAEEADTAATDFATAAIAAGEQRLVARRLSKAALDAASDAADTRALARQLSVATIEGACSLHDAGNAAAARQLADDVCEKAVEDAASSATCASPPQSPTRRRLTLVGEFIGSVFEAALTTHKECSDK